METGKKNPRKRKREADAFATLVKQSQTLSALFVDADGKGGFETEKAMESAVASASELHVALVKYTVQQKFIRVVEQMGEQDTKKSSVDQDEQKFRVWAAAVDARQLAALKTYLIQYVTFTLVDENDDGDCSEIATMSFPGGVALSWTYGGHRSDNYNSSIQLKLDEWDKWMTIVAPLTDTTVDCWASSDDVALFYKVAARVGSYSNSGVCTLKLDRLIQLRTLAQIPVTISNDLLVRTIFYVFATQSRFTGHHGVRSVIRTLDAMSVDDATFKKLRSTLVKKCALPDTIVDIISSLLAPFVSDDPPEMVSEEQALDPDLKPESTGNYDALDDDFLFDDDEPRPAFRSHV